MELIQYASENGLIKAYVTRKKTNGNKYEIYELGTTKQTAKRLLMQLLGTKKETSYKVCK